MAKTKLPVPRKWSNYHGNIDRAILWYDDPIEALKVFPPNHRRLRGGRKPIGLEPRGSGWSLAPIRDYAIHFSTKDWAGVLDIVADATGTYAIVLGGTRIGEINRVLAQQGWALPTSGASNGHTIGGATATSTHGAAWKYGSLSDAVMAVHLVTLEDKGAWITDTNPSPALRDYRKHIESATSLPAKLLPSTEVLKAARCHIGSLGFVSAVALEIVPLYALQPEVIRLPHKKLLQPESDSYHWEQIFDVHSDGSWLVKMRKCHPSSAEEPTPLRPGVNGEVLNTLSDILSTIPSSIFVTKVLEDTYKPGLKACQLPGDVFGETNLPRGVGISMEVAVPIRQAQRHLDFILHFLKEEARRRRTWLGPVACRRVRAGRSLIGINCPDNGSDVWNIEIPGLSNRNTRKVMDNLWANTPRLTPFAYHWGQMYPTRARRRNGQFFFRGRVRRYQQVRQFLLSDRQLRRQWCAPQMKLLAKGRTQDPELFIEEYGEY